MIKPQLFE